MAARSVTSDGWRGAGPGPAAARRGWLTSQRLRERSASRGSSFALLGWAAARWGRLGRMVGVEPGCPHAAGEGPGGSGCCQSDLRRCAPHLDPSQPVLSEVKDAADGPGLRRGGGGGWRSACGSPEARPSTVPARSCGQPGLGRRWLLWTVHDLISAHSSLPLASAGGRGLPPISAKRARRCGPNRCCMQAGSSCGLCRARRACMACVSPPRIGPVCRYVARSHAGVHTSIDKKTSRCWGFMMRGRCGNAAV